MEYLTNFFIKLLTIAFGVFMTIFFVLIPTIFFDANEVIPSIEKDLAIDIPAKYEITYKQKDHLALETHMEVELSFSDSDFQILLKEIENNPQWEKTDEGYKLKEDIKDKSYAVIGKVNTKDKTLSYYYSDF